MEKIRKIEKETYFCNGTFNHVFLGKNQNKLQNKEIFCRAQNAVGPILTCAPPKVTSSNTLLILPSKRPAPNKRPSLLFITANYQEWKGFKRNEYKIINIVFKFTKRLRRLWGRMYGIWYGSPAIVGEKGVHGIGDGFFERGSFPERWSIFTEVISNHENPVT